MKTIIDDLLPLTKKLSADWSEFLLRHNMEDVTRLLYDSHPRQTANTIVAYVILAYFQKSSWVRITKDRLENKIEIITSLLKKGWPAPAEYIKVIHNQDEGANQLIEWALHYQQDWRIPQIETYRSFHAHMRLLGSKRDSTDLQYYINVGKAMEEGRKRREEADRLQEQFDSDFAALNAALVQEKRPKLSDVPSHMVTWEQFIMLQNNARQSDQEQ